MSAQVQVVADGVLRIGTAGVNCYLVSADGGFTLVDAGLPGMWRHLEAALASFRATPADIDAVVLTHGHFDHVGMCRRLLASGVDDLRVHPEDVRLVRHPYRYLHENARLPYPFRFPRALSVLGGMTAAGALWVRGVDATGAVVPGSTLDVPGSLRAVFAPGHTDGSCAFELGDTGVLFSGDALVTLDPYTGRLGPRAVARAATADSAMALRSLDALAETGARLTLPGHGDPFEGPVAEAVASARRAGVA